MQCACIKNWNSYTKIGIHIHMSEKERMYNVYLKSRKKNNETASNVRK